MIQIRAGDNVFSAKVFVFDKDGLLFKSVPFWKGLADSRIKALESIFEPELIPGWAKMAGVFVEKGKKGYHTTDVDATGCFAIASPTEEMTVMAGHLAVAAKLPWSEAMKTSREIFAASDKLLDLKSSIKPRKGFPDIFRRLRDAKIPYGVATSDNHERTVRSVGYFDDPEKLSFIITPVDVTRGKPDAEMLELIAKKMKTETKHIVMIGDSVVDVMMAKNAGAIGIGIPENNQMSEKMEPYADVILKDLDEIVLYN